jgi:hypothetical protein
VTSVLEALPVVAPEQKKDTTLPLIVTDPDLVAFRQANQHNPAAVLVADALSTLYAAGCNHQTQGPGQHMASEGNPENALRDFPVPPA